MSNYTVKWPLEFTEKSIGFEAVDEKALKEMVVFNLKNIILTEPAERIMFPDMGVGIRRFLFSQSTGVDIENLKFKITSQVRTYAPYVNIVDLDVSIYENSLNISLRYEVTKIDLNDILVLNLEI